MRHIPRWQYQYLGTNTLLVILSQLELNAFFTFSTSELSTIRSRYKPTLRIAAALQLGFLNMTGRSLNAVRYVPAALLQHLGSQLDVVAPTIASLRGIYRRRPRTLWEHQLWAIDTLGFARPTDQQFRKLLPHLRQEARHAGSVDALVALGRVWLYQHRFVCPGDRPIRDYARQALATSEEGVIRLIRDAIPEPTLKEWEHAVLAAHADTGTSYLEWLQEAPRRRSLQALRDRIEFLKAMRVDEVILESIPLEKLRLYAAELRVRRPAKFRALKEPRRTLRLVCFLRFTLMHLTDTAVLLAGRQIAKIVRQAYEKARILEAEQSVSYRAVTQRIFAALEDASLSDGQFREQVRGLKHAQARPPFSSRAAATRWLLSESGTPIRALLLELQKLTLQSDGSTWIAQALARLTTLHATHSTQLPAGLSPTDYPKPWSNPRW